MTAAQAGSGPLATPPAPPDGRPARPPLVELRGITKRFPGVLANDRIHLALYPGEVLALLGENGAGKTTLVSILYGLHAPDEGEIRVQGRPVRIPSPAAALRLGIALVPQHPLLVERLTVAENLALGLPGGLLLRLGEVERRLAAVAAEFGLALDPRARVADLSAGEKQRVEIVRALLRGARVLILDEPTSALTPPEVEQLFRLLRRFVAAGNAAIFISHKLDEVLAIADRVAVLRRGRLVAALPAAGADKATLARLMVGREVAPPRSRVEVRAPAGAPVLEVEDLELDLGRARDGAAPRIRLRVHAGEIVGIAGIAGNGQRELVEVLAGLRPPRRGRVRIAGEEVAAGDPRALFARGVAHIPEHRLDQGTVPGMSLAENLALRAYRRRPLARGPWLDLRALEALAREKMAEYRIAAPGPHAPVRVLSGGNVQKVILARELQGHPRLILAVHPTAGLDVAATEQVHSLLLAKRQGGAAVLLVSEDLDEVLALSDRVAVLHRGALRGPFPVQDVTREFLGLLMVGEEA